MPTPPTLSEIREAAERLHGVALHTPLVPLHTYDSSNLLSAPSRSRLGSDASGDPSTNDILLKLEIHQPVTSFKIRGVYNAVSCLSPEARSRGLSTVSAGNTAQALAWVARRFGVASRSIMPVTAPVTKIEAVRKYGGHPVLVPTEEVFRFLKQRAWETEPYAFIHPWTNRDVMVGHGTIGLEIMADAPEVDTVYVPVGGGGLIGGVGAAVKALKPDVRVIAVEPDDYAALHESFAQEHAASMRSTTAPPNPTAIECPRTPRHPLCDGVAVPYITDEVFPILRQVVDDVVMVSEAAVECTIERLAVGNRVIVEGSAALPVAAALATPAAERGLSVCVVTGGSIDLDRLIEILGS